MARPKKSLERDTRALILERALDLFAEQGFFATSVREIAKAVGIRQSALYHYFPSKEAMLQGLLEHLGPGQAARFQDLDFEGMAKAFGARRLLAQLVENILAAWSTPQEQKFFRLILQEGMKLRSAGVVEPRVQVARVRGLVERVLRTFVELELSRPIDVNAAALAFLGPLMVLRLTYLAFPNETPDWASLRRDADRYLDFFWDSIKPLKPTAHARLAK